MSFSDLRFTRIIKGREKTIEYESGTTSASRICELNNKGQANGNNYVVSQEELEQLIELYGTENFRILMHDQEKRCEEYLIYRESNGEWIGILYNEDASERKPFFVENTKFRLYHKMLIWLVKRLNQLEKENETLKSSTK